MVNENFLESGPERKVVISYPEIEGIKIKMVPLIDFSTTEIPVEAQWIDEEQPLLPELESVRDQTIQEIKARGGRVVNGEIVSLNSFNITTKRINLVYQPSQYFTLIGTHISLDKRLPSGKTVRETYGDLEQMVTPEGYNSAPYAKMVGISGVVLTTDQKVILQRRSNLTAYAPGQMHVALAEVGHPNDVDKNGKITPVASVIRGFRQELSSPNQTIDINESHVKLLTLGISRQYLYPEFVLLVEAPYSASRVMELAKQARGRWERSEIYIEDFTRENIVRLLREHEWMPHGAFALAMALKEKEL